MRSLITGLAVLVFAGLLAGCGALAITGPAVSVEWKSDDYLPAPEEYSATLTPTGDPSGVIALKVVHDGGVRTLAAYRFTALQDPGTAVVTIAGRTISVVWTLPGGVEGPESKEVRSPHGMQPSLSYRNGGAVGPANLDGEWILWAQEYYRDVSPTKGEAHGEIEKLAAMSKQQPDRTTYCLTLEVESR